MTSDLRGTRRGYSAGTLDRRPGRLVLCVLWGCLAGPLWAVDSAVVDDRVRGLLVGSLLGDAAGGPVEFQPRAELAKWFPDLRSWTERDFANAIRTGALAKSWRMLPYAGVRDEIAAYGPWQATAPSGTLTDDSRHKMIFMNALRRRLSATAPLAVRDLCRAYLAFGETDEIQRRTAYAGLARESLREYHAVARWSLGDRDLRRAVPPQRLWAGIATCSGQMALLPIAAVYPGNAESAYRAAYSMDFVDVGQAKDLCAALVAGLAHALDDESASVPARWENLLAAIRETDPYRYADVPFAKRPATEWLDFALQAADRAQGKPAALYQILEREGKPTYYWDAHFTYACAFAFLKFCEFRPRESMVVSLAFGHDTDSVAQLIGALAGAVEGTRAFSHADQERIQHRLVTDYGQDISEWVLLLRRARELPARPGPIQFLEWSAN